MNLSLPDTEIHVWQVVLSVSSFECQQFVQILSADEQARAERFRFPRDRDRFIASRGTLRTLLGRYLNTSPEHIKFHYGAKGKPALAEAFAMSGLEFNLSHSEDLMVCAIAHQQVGIDLEHLRPVADLENLTERFFSLQEHTTVCALPSEQRLKTFFQYWTCKEAVLKAAGDGLMSLSAIEVHLLNETAKLVRWDNDTQAPQTWTLQLFTPAPDYTAAIAVKALGQTIVFKRWEAITA